MTGGLHDPPDDPSNRPTRMANYGADGPRPPGSDDHPDYVESCRTGIAAGPVVSEPFIAGRLGHDGRDPDRADHLRPHPALARRRRWSVHHHTGNDTHAVVVTNPVDNTTVDDDHATAVTVLVGRAGAAGWQRPASGPGPAPGRAAGASPPYAAHSVDDHVAAHRDYAAARFLRRGGSRLGREAAECTARIGARDGLRTSRRPK